MNEEKLFLLHALSYLLERFVDGIELLGLLRQLQSNILRPDKDTLQVHPLALNCVPHVEGLIYSVERALPTAHLFRRTKTVTSRIEIKAFSPTARVAMYKQHFLVRTATTAGSHLVSKAPNKSARGHGL